MSRMDQLAMAFKDLAKTAEKFGDEFCRPGDYTEPWFGGCKGFCRITFPRRVMILLSGPEKDSRPMVEAEGGRQCLRAMAWIEEHYDPAYARVLAALPRVDVAATIEEQWFACARRYRRVRDAVEILVHNGNLKANDADYLVKVFGVLPTPLCRMSLKYYQFAVDGWEPPNPFALEGCELSSQPEDSRLWVEIGKVGHDMAYTSCFVSRREIGEFFPYMLAAPDDLSSREVGCLAIMLCGDLLGGPWGLRDIGIEAEGGILELVLIQDRTNWTCGGKRWAIVPVVPGLRGDYAMDDLGRWCRIPAEPHTWTDREQASSQWPPRLPPVLVGSHTHQRALKCGWTPPPPASAIEQSAFKEKLRSLLALEEASEQYHNRGLLDFDLRKRHAYLDRARKHYKEIPEPRDQKLREIIRAAHRSATRFEDYPADGKALPTVREVMEAHRVNIELE